MALAILLLSATLAQAECANCEPERTTRLPAVISEEQADEKQRRAENAVRIDVTELKRSTPALELTDVLAEVPGVIARDRRNFAQDTQISVRGFGARSAFGVRGVRIEYDGIPATAADGQSQVGHIDLASAGQVEVIRGPFAALYGNGGAFIRIDGSGARAAAPQRFSLGIGTDGQRRQGVLLDGGERVHWDLSANRFETAGARAQSAAERTLVSAHADLEVADDGLLSFSANRQDQPDAQDPQGLTRAEFELDPGASNPSAQLFGTAKSTLQDQVGARYRQDLGPTRLEASAYAGQRQIDQVLSVSRAAQTPPGNGGGIVDLGRDYAGTALRLAHERELAIGAAQLSLELRAERLLEERRGYENFVGPQLGVRGALRRDERNHALVRDAIVRFDLDPTPAWRLSVGARRNATRYDSDDHYIAPGNPDDSGSYSDAAWLPVAGVLYRVSDGLQLHAAAGRTHELPTLAELAYRADGDGGFNQELQPARARQGEVGVRVAAERWRLEATAFRVDGDSEIVVDTSDGGRTSFQNAGSTRRQGLELAGDYAFSRAWRARGVLSLTEARYTSDYSTCTRQPCTTPDFTIVAGRRMPGVVPRQAMLQLAWNPNAAWNSALVLQALDSSPASDRNDDRVPGYATLSLRVNRDFVLAPEVRLQAQLRVDNLTDHSHSESLIVNEGNRRYFEPAPGRSVWVGVEVRFL